jgi:hypothetical protein
MSEFGDDVRALRQQLAEAGLEITIDDLLEVLEESLAHQVNRACVTCFSSAFGLCFPCLSEMVRTRP